MTAELETDPSDVGLDPGRLARIDTHFRRYVDDGRLAGYQVLVARRGRSPTSRATATATRGTGPGCPSSPRTPFRIYSMTKPITSVASMTLWEEAPSSCATRVTVPPSGVRRHAGVARRIDGEARAGAPGRAPMEIGHLFTHTSGLTYGFHHRHPTDELYRDAGGTSSVLPRAPPSRTCATPGRGSRGRFQPGTRWNYGVSTDVLGRLVEVISGQPLDELLRSVSSSCSA